MKNSTTLKTLAKTFWPVFLFVSCATDIDYKIPSHRFVDPETRGTSLFRGEFSGFGQVSYQLDTKLTMTEVYDFGVFGSAVNDDQAFDETGNLGVQAGLGVFPKVDILYRNNGDSPRMGLLKVQVLGSGLNELQEEFKLALWGGAGSMDEDEGSVTVTDDSQTDIFNGRIEVTPWELGLSLGQRLNGHALVYMNLIHAQYPSKSTLSSSGQSDIVVEGRARQQALTLGLKLHQQNISCHLEAGYTQVHWKEDIDIEQKMGTVGAAVSAEF